MSLVCISIDFITDLPIFQGNTIILTIIDRFSKACCLIPLPKLPTAMETAEDLSNWVFRFYALSEDIVSDRGPEVYLSSVVNLLQHNLNINVSLTSGYHPKSNDQTKCLNQELTLFLQTYCNQNQSDWSNYFLWAEYAENSLRKLSTGLTQLQCVLGYPPWSGEPTDLLAVNDRFKGVRQLGSHKPVPGADYHSTKSHYGLF